MTAAIPAQILGGIIYPAVTATCAFPDLRVCYDVSVLQRVWVLCKLTGSATLAPAKGGLSMVLGWQVVFGFAVLSGAAAGEMWLDADSYGDVRVVVAASASESEKEAAREFRRYWKDATGHDIEAASSPDAGGVNVWIGRDGLPATWLAGLNLDALGTDGVCLRTVDAQNLIIVGGRERGTLYGVYEFFERYVGVRWLTPEVTHIPEPPPHALRTIDYRYVPPFIYRDTSYTVRRPNKAYFEQVHKQSRHPGIGLGVHSFYMLLPPDEYFAEHPEYYSEIQGERVALLGVNAYDPADMLAHPEARGAQLCLSNPEVVAALATSLKRIMREQPDRKIFNVAQMDWANNCQCDACRAIDEQEGSPSGSILTAINSLADIVAEEFPDCYVGTLAYQYSRRPPKHIRPRDNVLITLCSIECDFSVPLDDPRSSINRGFIEDLKGWAA
ncbi:MAG TPA: DUF4838 domain-containing protein, partial [Candidatus Hydrogenedentes bacterium]|nr:DUF4838 domain-containing protein [Candidatus Hydrogenedentota bacterium]